MAALAERLNQRARTQCHQRITVGSCRGWLCSHVIPKLAPVLPSQWLSWLFLLNRHGKNIANGPMANAFPATLWGLAVHAVLIVNVGNFTDKLFCDIKRTRHILRIFWIQRSQIYSSFCSHS